MSERFVLLDRLGSGGMGVVWKARDTATGDIVALKLLKPELVDDRAYRERFQREVDITQRINSPHVVRTIGFGRIQAQPFIAMEFVEGRSLRDVLAARGPMPWPQARRILVDAARGLDAAHRAGVIHRDIKPSNIMLTPGGSAKVADFGIARALDLTPLTRSATMLGTPLYMAPDERVTAQSDLYSLGCVGFEMLTGAPPFTGDTQQEVLMGHMRRRPDLERIADAEARLIVGWLLEKEASRRPGSAAVLVSVLSGATQVPRTLTSVGDGGQKRWLKPVGALAIGALLAAVGTITTFALLGGNDGDDGRPSTPGEASPTPEVASPTLTVTRTATATATQQTATATQATVTATATTTTTPTATATATATPTATATTTVTSAPAITNVGCSPGTVNTGQQVSCSATLSGAYTSIAWAAPGAANPAGGSLAFSTTWSSPGQKSITFRACNGVICSERNASVAVDVPPPSPPVVNSIGCSSTSVTTGQQVSCSPSLGGGAAATFAWNSGGGNPVAGSGPTFAATWASAGQRLITLQACNAGGCSPTASWTVTVNPPPPATPIVHTLGCSPAAVQTGQGVTCTPSLSGGAPASWAWSASGGSPSSGSGSSFTTSWSAPGAWSISLQVCNASGCANGSANVTVESPQPSYALNVTMDRFQYAPGDPARFCITIAPETPFVLRLLRSLDGGPIELLRAATSTDGKGGCLDGVMGSQAPESSLSRHGTSTPAPCLRGECLRQQLRVGTGRSP